MMGGARIFTFLVAMVFAMLHAEPLVRPCRASNEPTCSVGKKCEGQAPLGTGDCESKGCNPFVPCGGGCCYLPTMFSNDTPQIVLKKERFAMSDDNRLAEQLSECWRPPWTEKVS